MQHLCLEAASAATLPPAKEAALLGTPPGMGAAEAAAELELELLIKELATATTLPPAEEAALLGTPPGLGASAAAEEPPPPVDEASLPQPLAVLRCKPEGHPEATDTVYYLLGTAHISEQSCADVARLVRAVRPDVSSGALRGVGWKAWARQACVGRAWHEECPYSFGQRPALPP